MKIIVNPQLRKLKKLLEKDNIKYDDFMLNKKLLRFDDDTQYHIIYSLQYINVNKEQFNFLLIIFNDNENLFYKLVTLIGHDVEIGQKQIELYFQNKDIYELLVDIKINNIDIDSLNQLFVDMWGLNVIKENYDIIDKFTYDEVKEYIDIIKSNPSVLRYLLPLLLSPSYNKIYLQQVLKLSNKTNIKDVVNNLIALNDDYLKKCYLDNYNDEELKTFCQLIISKYNGSIPVRNDEIFINELIKETKISKTLAKKICYYHLLQLKSSEGIKMGALSIIFDTNFPLLFDVYGILVEANNKGYPIPDGLKEFYEFYDDLVHRKKTTEELINKAHDSIYNSSINFDFNEAIKWVKQFKCWELNKDVISVEGKNIDYYEQYVYVDENGHEVVKQIPVIRIDNPNFRAIIHKVLYKNKDDSPANYELTEKLIDNPILWETTKGGNPNISMSYLYKQIGTFGGIDGVYLGFSKMEPERLLATFSADAATPMDRSVSDKIIEFCPHEHLEGINGVYGNKGCGYNELLMKRYYNNEVAKPDYIMVISGVAYTPSIELAKKWAAYFGIPIVEIDGKKIKEYHINEYQTILNNIKEKHYIQDYSIIRSLYEELALIEGYRGKGEKFSGPTLYETFYVITQNIDINTFENAQYINELLRNLEHAKSEDWFVIDYSREVDMHTHKYIDPRMSDEKLNEMKNYVDYIKAKCQQLLSNVEIQERTGIHR